MPMCSRLLLVPLSRMIDAVQNGQNHAARHENDERDQGCACSVRSHQELAGWGTLRRRRPMYGEGAYTGRLRFVPRPLMFVPWLIWCVHVRPELSLGAFMSVLQPAWCVHVRLQPAWYIHSNSYQAVCATAPSSLISKGHTLPASLRGRRSRAASSTPCAAPRSSRAPACPRR